MNLTGHQVSNLRPPRRLNIGGSEAPRLLVYGNRWGLQELPQLPRVEPWSFETILDRLASAGFDGVQADASVREMIASRGLRYCTGGRANTPKEADALIAAAADEGADCITLHVGWGMETDAEMDALALAILDASDRHRVPAYIETHRQTMTQDLWRLCRLIERFPDLRFNGDYSHLYCGNEMNYGGRFALSREHLSPVLERTQFIHGRVSDGQCMQIDVGEGDPAANTHVANFLWMWTTAMTHWLRAAGPGDALIFAPELGPPASRYSITHRQPDGQIGELSDRWAQTLVLKRLAEQAFTEARRIASVEPAPETP